MTALPIALPPIASLTEPVGQLGKQTTAEKVETELFATLLRTSHVFDLKLSAGKQMSDMFGGVLSQLLAQEMVSSHQIGFGALAYTGAQKISGGCHAK